MKFDISTFPACKGSYVYLQEKNCCEFNLKELIVLLQITQF